MKKTKEIVVLYKDKEDILSPVVLPRTISIPLETPPDANIVIVEGGCIDVPLSQLMSNHEEIYCVICGLPLPLEETKQKTVVIDGGKYAACRKCNV